MEVNDSFVERIGKMLEKAEKALAEYPLCNSCLGRLFAKYGVGLSNYERGQALKTLLAIKLYEKYTEGSLSKDQLRKMAIHAGEGIASMYRKVFGEDVLVSNCYICGNRLGSKLIEEIASRVCTELHKYEASTFLVGVTLDESVSRRELELVVKYGVETSESIKREIKREVGKAVATLCKVTPDFSNPSVLIVVNVDSEFNYDISVKPSPIFLSGYYWKLGRRISHVPWYTKTGSRKYPLSIQEVVESVLKNIFMAEQVAIHASGREDVDARMVGSGRPLIIELKSPKRRNVSVHELGEYVREALADSVVKLEVVSSASRNQVRLLKELSKRKRKAYRVTVYSLENVEPADLRVVEEFFSNREVRQRTPLRIIRRKRDRERVRRVYAVKTRRVSNRVFEALIYCDGGLYVKELVHCDEGRTNPCFAGVLGKQLIPVELDVLYVEE